VRFAVSVVNRAGEVKCGPFSALSGTPDHVRGRLFSPLPRVEGRIDAHRPGATTRQA
jgi:hypothetical protein